MKKQVRNDLRFILLLIRQKLIRLMAFRLSFFGAFFADGTLFLVQLLVFNVIYGQVESIGGWGRGQMLIFVGTFSMINGLNMLIYFFGLADLSGKIRSGALDAYITKPGSTLLRITFEEVDFGSAPLVLLSAGIIGYGLSVAGINVTLPLLLGYTALVLLMTLLYYDMELILRCIPFFLVGVSAIDRLEGEMLMLNFKIPGVLFRGVFKVLFYFVMPYGIMSTVPTQFVTGAWTPLGLLHALAVVVVFTWFALWLWRVGLRHYKSASS